MPLSKNDAERDMLNVTMHWYWFQMLTMRSSFALPVEQVKTPRSESQCALSAANARSTFAAVSNFARMACAGFLLITPLRSHLSFSGSST